MISYNTKTSAYCGLILKQTNMTLLCYGVHTNQLKNKLKNLRKEINSSKEHFLKDDGGYLTVSKQTGD
jgi:hypothetical protein